MSTPPHPDRDPDADTGSVTAWIGDVKSGDAAAARRLWDRYFRRMTHYSRARLRGSERREADEEDVALSAFDSFCRAAGAGRFPRLDGRDQLWALLVRIMVQKAADRIAREKCQKRGGRVVRAGDAALDGVAAGGPPPDLAAELADEFRRLLELLPDPSLRAVAVLKFEGYTADEIAGHLGCGLRTVERKLLLIRRHWSEGRP